MATTTPNFGWSVPTSTDLVKDGATAIETLGDSIDASLVDLKGGTTGQVLAKASGTDMDFSWIAQDDSNAIQNAIVDAKGDLITATAADTPARLAVGTNGFALVADSTEATGLKWAAAGGMVLLSTTTLSGFSTTVSSISQDYTHLFIEIFGITSANNRYLDLKFNGGGNFTIMRAIGNNGTFQSQAQTNVGVLRTTYGEITANNANNVGSFTIYNYAATNHRKNVETHIAYNTTESVMTSSAFLSDSAVSSISFTEEAGAYTWTAGTVKIWGVK